MHYVERQPTTFMDVDLYMLRPRVSRETLFAIGGWSGGQASALVEAYDNRAHRWYALSQVCETVFDHYINADRHHNTYSLIPSKLCL